MIDLRVKGDATKIRLLEAAERMIADKGFEAVSVRDITGLAKANVAAVNYHFGSREGLLALLISQRVEPIMKQRADAMGAIGEPSSLREWLEAWVKPLCGAEANARLLGRCLEVLVEDGLSATANHARAVDGTFILGLARLLPQLSHEDITWRFHFAQGALVHTLIHGATWAGQFSIVTAMERWIASSLLLFTEGQSYVQASEEVTPKAKPSPRRQIAEVVASAMEEVDAPSEISEAPAAIDEVPESKPVSDEASPKPRAKSARGKKAKADDDTGELFLF